MTDKTASSAASPAAQPMMSRRERKKLETRRRILDAAISLMSAASYDAVKIEDIARKADIANATFFLHFPNKASLIAAFNEQVSEKIAERLKEFSLPAADQLELLRALVLDEWSRHGALLRQFVVDAANDGNALIASSDSLAALAEQIVRDGQEAGEFAADYDPALVASTLTAGWRASTVSWAVTGDDDKARRDNRQILDLILNGLVRGGGD
ncbi:MAG: TetR/AcrR family transcriptional regulator [Pseudomonadota bacterium]